MGQALGVGAGGHGHDDRAAARGRLASAGDRERPGPARARRARPCGARRRRPARGRRRRSTRERGERGRRAGVGATVMSACVEPRHGGVDALGQDHSTASAASSTSTRPAARGRASTGGCSTWSAPRSLPPGGLPMPIRTRAKSSVWRWALIDRSPLWPARPPPTLTWMRPGGEVELVVDDHQPRQVLDAEAAHQRGDRPARVVHVGLREGQRQPRAARSRTSATRARVLATPSAARRGGSASSSTTSAPTLWRVPAYSAPGLPRPTTSRSAGVPRRAAPWRASERHSGRRFSPRRRRSRSAPSRLGSPVAAASSSMPPRRPRPPPRHGWPSSAARVSDATTTGVLGVDLGGDAGGQDEVADADGVVDLEVRRCRPRISFGMRVGADRHRQVGAASARPCRRSR